MHTIMKTHPITMNADSKLKTSQLLNAHSLSVYNDQSDVYNINMRAVYFIGVEIETLRFCYSLTLNTHVMFRENFVHYVVLCLI